MAVKGDSMIVRNNLIRKFDELTEERLIYVCAPAGYGKTVAVRQWLDRNDRMRATITLDEYDNNLSQFCERFCAALQTCQPQNKDLFEIISHPGFNGTPDEFTLRAIVALTRRKQIILVIDDLHFIHNKKILDLLIVFLKRLPENCQIILISRNDLPSVFSDLWIKGNLVNITTEQFCFSEDEIRMLYKKRGNTITQEQASNIRRFTDGWAIGINALLLSDETPSSKSFKYLEKFIRLNVWDKWDESIREFMLSTAAARELNPSLCNVLTGEADSEKLLQDLMQSGVFIYQTSCGVYHYYNLFHDFLKRMQEERGNEYLYRLLEKEGEWNLNRQDFYNAAECFIRCCNHDGIAKCFDLLEITVRNNFVLERMIHIIKNPKIRVAADKYPFLFYMLAWVAFAEGRSQDMFSYMDQYYARFPEIATRYHAHTHNTFFMRIMDVRTSLQDLKNEIMTLPVTDRIRGSIAMNMPLFHRSNRDFSELAGENTEANVLEFSDTVKRLLGEEARILSCCLAAGLLYEQGHLEKAYLYAMTANAEIKAHFAPESKFNAISILVYVLDAMGDRNQAEQSLSRFEQTIEFNKAPYLKHNFKAILIRRKLANGDVKAAVDWFIEYESAPYNALNCFGMYGIITACRAYICIGDYDKAILLLTKVLEIVQSFNRHLGIIEVHILLSIAYWKKKRSFQEVALWHLKRAVVLAYRFRYTQIFTNEGAEIAGMLRRLQKRAEQPGKGDELSVSFIKLLYVNALDHQESGLTSGQSEYSVKYTDKQKSVMKLLCEGKSYQEITQRMGIKLPTLRSHIALIYKKLDVTREVDAIIKIKSLGILSEM